MNPDVTDSEPKQRAATLTTPTKNMGPKRRAPSHASRNAHKSSCLRDTLLTAAVLLFLLIATLGIVVCISILTTETITFGYNPEDIPGLVLIFFEDLKKELLPPAWLPKIGREGAESWSKRGKMVGSYSALPSITRAQLAQLDGSQPGLDILLSITGLVFDVSSGAQHYQSGGAYNFLAGKDATISFVTGCFDEECFATQKTGWDAVDADGRRSINDWLLSYKEKYILKSRLEGVYELYHGNDPAQKHQKFFTPLADHEKASPSTPPKPSKSKTAPKK